MADAADGICPRNENVSSTDGSTCTLKINADDTGDASSDACGCAAPDGRELGTSKKWQNKYWYMLTDEVRRNLELENHRKFMRQCIANLRSEKNQMGGLAHIFQSMLDCPTSMDEHIHTAQIYTWYPAL